MDAACLCVRMLCSPAYAVHVCVLVCACVVFPPVSPFCPDSRSLSAPVSLPISPSIFLPASVSFCLPAPMHSMAPAHEISLTRACGAPSQSQEGTMVMFFAPWYATPVTPLLCSHPWNVWRMRVRCQCRLTTLCNTLSVNCFLHVLCRP